MTAAEIISASRTLLNDLTQPYKWTDTELLQYLNDALNTIARETDYFIDTYTSSVIHISITAGTQDYAISTNVLNLLNARLASESQFLTKTTLNEMNEKYQTWRYTSRVSGTDISFTNSGTADYLTSTTTDLSVFQPGDDIVISGSTSNNGLFTVLSSTATVLTLSTSDSLTTEASGDTVIIIDPYTGTATKYLTDYRTGYITIYPCPEEADTLVLQTIRRFSATLATVETIGDISTTTNVPDIRSDFHFGLCDGILYRAFLKVGVHINDPKRSQTHFTLFSKLIDSIKRDMIKSRAMGKTVTPHSGTL